MRPRRSILVPAGLGVLVLSSGLGLALSSCSTPTVPTVDCETAMVPSYKQIKFSVMAYCTDCHGEDRAESGVRYDSYEAATAGATLGAETIADGSMPEEFEMPGSAAQYFYAWAQCGTPE
jgi:hypothetical protein